MRKTKRNMERDIRGFTLIELLAIIAIIGLLAGAIFVSLRAVRENSEKKSLTRTMGTVVRAAGVCENINYIGSAGDPICSPPVGDVTYPQIDPKLDSEGYGYRWQAVDSEILEGTKDDGGVTEVIIECSVGSGTCEEL